MLFIFVGFKGRNNSRVGIGKRKANHTQNTAVDNLTFLNTKTCILAPLLPSIQILKQKSEW